MTNKQERYYVVSESELEAALKAVRTAEVMCSDSGVRDERFELLAEVAAAACRARPVPEGTRFVDCFHTDGTERLGSILFEEIKK